MLNRIYNHRKHITMSAKIQSRLLKSRTGE